MLEGQVLVAAFSIGVTAIPAEFDWHDYHSSQVAEPGRSPEGAIRGSASMTAGEG